MQGNFRKASTAYLQAVRAHADGSESWNSRLSYYTCLLRLNKTSAAKRDLESVVFDISLFQYLDFNVGIESLLDADQAHSAKPVIKAEEFITTLESLNQQSEDPNYKIKLALLLGALYDWTGSHEKHFDLLQTVKHHAKRSSLIESQIVDNYEMLLEKRTYLDKIVKSVKEDLVDEYLDSDIRNRTLKALVAALYESKQYATILDLASATHLHYIQQAGVLFEYAYSLSEVDQHKQSIEIYQHLLTVNPNNTSALNNLGVNYKSLARFNEAYECFKRAASFDKKNPLYQNNLSVTREQLDKIKLENKTKLMPVVWRTKVNELTVERLDKFGYFSIVEQIEKLSNKYRPIIKRDFQEVVFNAIVENHKAVIGNCKYTVFRNLEYTTFGNKST
jgi:tetratricopeptide (TPR) repeat protein